MDEERPNPEFRAEIHRPFFRRRDTWLILAGLLLLPLSLWIPLDAARLAEAGLDPQKVRLGIGIFLCIGFLWVMAGEIVNLVDGWPVILIIGTSLLFVILLGEFSSNTATTALMVPIFYSVAKELGLAPAKLVIPLALASSCGFMLPVATPPNAIVFATGRIPQREMLRAGALLDGVCLIVVSLLAWWVF